MRYYIHVMTMNVTWEAEKLTLFVKNQQKQQ